MKIGILPNLEKSGADEITKRAVSLLVESGAEVFCSTEGYSVPVMAEEEILRLCDPIVTVGGDGTIIQYAKQAAVYKKGLLGINAGRLGFLADIDATSLGLLKKLVSGEYNVTKRFMIEAKVYSNGVLVAEGKALNDAVVSSGGNSRLVDIEVGIESDVITYRGDGIIISTPTGSTAYSMSAGGPIIAPDVRCFAITPVCSHSLTARPTIIGEEGKLTLKMPAGNDSMAVFSLDGRYLCNMDKNTEIVIEKAEYDAMLISLSGSNIFKTLSQKFRW